MSDNSRRHAKQRPVDAPDPNARDYARVVRDESDGKFHWQVFAGNGYLTHESKRGYSRQDNAMRALAREHPGIEVRET